MDRRMLNRKKGQVIAELAIFASVIILIFGYLLSYLQRSNDQQYVQMEAFRRALERACTYQGEESEGAGGSVQLTLIENRRHVDLSSGYMKGSSQTFSGSSSVFWAVPKVGQDPESVTLYRINEDEYEAKYRDFISEDEEEDKTFQVEEPVIDSTLTFNETATKEETPEGIVNTDISQLSHNITTNLTYTIRAKDDDSDPDNDTILEESTFWNVTQGLYRAPDGQYKYSQQAVDNVVERGKIWQTSF